MKQKLGTRPYGHYVVGVGRAKECGCVQLVGLALFSLLALSLFFPFSLFGPPVVGMDQRLAIRSEHPRPTTTMDPYTATYQTCSARLPCCSKPASKGGVWLCVAEEILW